VSRSLLGLVALLLLLAALPGAPAAAVTITEVAIDPAAAPGQIQPRYVRSGPDGTL
jgi:hypothetical protein